MRQRHDNAPPAGSAARLRTGAAAWLARAGLAARAGYHTTARRVRTFRARPVTDGAEPPQADTELRPSPFLYLSVGLVAGAVIALQIGIMRLFSVGSWAHFGSLVVSLAMLGFGLTSAIMCVRKAWFERHWQRVAMTSLLLFGPLTVAANLLAQQIPFNAIFLVSDPAQKWRLFGNFLLYMLPFLAGAFYLGTVFLKAQRIFGRVYFADLTGSGLCGLLFLGAMYFVTPENLLIVPLVLWLAGSVLWCLAVGRTRPIAWLAATAVGCAAVHLAAPAFDVPNLFVSDYKGVSYARKFPDNERVYARASPFGYLEVYSSSYLHFAPGLSDNAAFNLPTMPANAYLGLYIDGEGPSGIIRDLPANETAYFRYLPMIYPYLLKQVPDTFVVQFGGGISTAVALKSNSNTRDGGGGQSGRPQRLPLRPGPARLHRRRPQPPARQGHRLRGAPLPRPHQGPVRHRRSEPRRLRGPVEPRRLRHRREVRLLARGHGELHARPQGRRHPLRHAVEQGGAAQVGAEALRHHGRGGAPGRRRRHRRPLLRGLELPVDGNRALQARRLHAA